MSDLFIALGTVLVIIGLVLKTGFKIPLLPGDIFIKTETTTVYFPIVTSIVVSIILSLIIGRMRK